MDSNEVQIVAAAAGTIMLKRDGNFDRSCGFGQCRPPAGSVYDLRELTWTIGLFCRRDMSDSFSSLRGRDR